MASSIFTFNLLIFLKIHAAVTKAAASSNILKVMDIKDHSFILCLNH